MIKHVNELKKLILIATDLELSEPMRFEALQQIGEIGTSEALHALLEIAGNEKLSNKERDTALKKARDILRSNR